MKTPGRQSSFPSNIFRYSTGLLVILILAVFSNADAQVAKKLQILLPGMTAAPGTATGYTGEPEGQTKGIPFEIIVNVVDENWNVVPSSDQISVSSSDPYASLPLPVNVVDGTARLSITLNSTGNQAISIHDDSNSAVQSVTSPALNVVELGYFTISEIGDPWWVMPGQVTVGEEIKQVEIIARDNNGNRVYDYNQYVDLSEQTDYGIGRISPQRIRLEAGKWKGSVWIYRAGKKTRGWGVTGDVWVRAFDGGIQGESNRFCALPGDFKRLLTVVPGENHLPGSLTGKSGSPNSQQAGKDFFVDVFATDEFFNLKTNVAHTISLSSSDAAATLPSSQSMSNGAVSMLVKLNTQGSQTITARDVNNSSILNGVSSPIEVFSSKLDHFTISSISSPQTAGSAFSSIITAVDAQGNLISNFNATLDLSASTGLATISPSEITMTNGWWSGEITLTKAASLVTVNVQDRTNPPQSGVSNQFNVVPGPAHKMQVLLPGEAATPGVAPGKTGYAGEVLAGTNFYTRVNVVDEWWNVIPNNVDVVHLSSTDPSASLPQDISLNNGTRQFLVALNNTGLQTISATNQTNPSVLKGTSSQIRVNPGNLDRFVFNPINGPQQAGIPFSVTITAVDPQGNPVSNYTGMVLLSASTGDNTLIPVTANFSNGSWTGNITMKKASGGVYLSASDGATPAHTGQSNDFEVKPGPLAAFQVIVPGLIPTPGIAPGYSGTPQVQNAGEPFPMVVNGVDQYWNVVTTSSDSFGVSSTDLYASLPEPTVLAKGTRSLSITLNGAGNHTVSAFHLNNPAIHNGQTPEITILPQDLDHFTFKTITGPATAGEPVSVTIEARGTEDQKLFGFSGILSISASTDEGTVTPAEVGPFENGEWTGEIRLTRAATEVTVSVSDNGTPVHTGTSNAFTVLAGSFKKLHILLPGEELQAGVAPGKSGQPLDQLTGDQFEARVLAVDNYWNLVSSVSDSIRLLSSDENATLTAKSKLINGSARPTVMMGTAGTHTLTAEDITDPEKLAAVSSAFNVNPGNLDHFEFDAIADQTAGNGFSIRITASDVAGNPVAGYNGHARLQTSTGQATLSPTEIDFVDGVWTGKITITRAMENAQLTCMDYASTPHSGQSNLFKISAGTFTRMQILLPGETATPGVAPGKTGEVETQVSGDAVIVTVNAVDAWWNPIVSADGLVGITSTDQNATLPLDAAMQAGTITFSDVRLNTPGYWTLTAQYKTDLQISSDTSPLIHVISGSVASFAFDPIKSPQTAGDTIQVTIRAVDGNGETVKNYSETASLTSSTGPGTIFAEQVKFADGAWSGPVVVTKAVQSAHLNIHDFADVVRGNSNPFTLVSGELKRLQILMPGETATPGLAPGKTGNPYAQISGIPFQTSLRVTDAWWNAVKPESLSVHFSSTDLLAVLPSDTLLAADLTSFPLTFLTPGKNTLIVQDIEHGVIIDSSTSVFVQSCDHHHYAISAIDSNRVAGSPFTVKIEAQNQNDYPVTDYEGDIILSASTGNGTLSQTGVTMANGVWQGQLAVTRADSNVVLYAADYVPAPNTHTGYSNAFSVIPDKLAGLQIVLPGQSATPGVAPGKKGDATSHIAGNNVNVLVRAVDAYYNLIRSQSDSLTLSVSDSFAAVSSQLALENGELQIPVTLRAAGKHTIRAKFSQQQDFAEAVSDSFSIQPNQFSQLLVLLPGEAPLPGDTENDPLKTPGRKDTPLKQTSGLPFPVNVYAVDDYWNLLTSVPSDHIRLFTTDNAAAVENSQPQLVGGKSTFSVTLKQGGNQIIRAIDETNSQIRTSLDGLVDVLVGGLHYELQLSANRVAAGEPFEMKVFYKNGIGETIPGASQVVHLSAVDAQDITKEVGAVENASFNLQGGQRTIQQVYNSVGTIRIKVVDETETAPAYSDPIEIFAGSVSGIEFSAPKTELRGKEEVTLSTQLLDGSGNPVTNQEVKFELLSGTGQLKQNATLSDEKGIASVVFVAGKVSETNVVRASVDSVYTDFEILVNLTPSTLADGKPINYPNPFGLESDVTHIEYYLPEDADVTLQIFDLFGNLVWTKNIAAGQPGGRGRNSSNHPNSIAWAGVNDRGQRVGNGGYILIARATANGKSVMDAKRKIAVMR
ncbi:MAG: hypothetical protein P8184_02615 [Calditrichia bacterium]